MYKFSSSGTKSQTADSLTIIATKLHESWAQGENSVIRFKPLKAEDGVPTRPLKLGPKDHVISKTDFLNEVSPKGKLPDSAISKRRYSFSEPDLGKGEFKLPDTFSKKYLDGALFVVDHHATQDRLSKAQEIPVEDIETGTIHVNIITHCPPSVMLQINRSAAKLYKQAIGPALDSYDNGSQFTQADLKSLSSTIHEKWLEGMRSAGEWVDPKVDMAFESLSHHEKIKDVNVLEVLLIDAFPADKVAIEAAITDYKATLRKAL